MVKYVLEKVQNEFLKKVLNGFLKKKQKALLEGFC